MRYRLKFMGFIWVKGRFVGRNFGPPKILYFIGNKISQFLSGNKFVKFIPCMKICLQSISVISGIIFNIIFYT